MTDYLSLIFDHDRFGFRRLAHLIAVTHLDYHGLIRLKRTSRYLYHFLADTDWEQQQLRRKLRRDTRRNHVEAFRRVSVRLPGEVSAGKIFDRERRVVLSVRKSVWVVDLRSGEVERELKGNRALVTCLAVDEGGKWVVGGAQDGQFSLWDVNTGDLLVTKQLFGRLESIQWQSSYIVTGHSGKANDVGCLCVRRFVSPDDIPVVFSMFGDDLFPVFQMDFDRHFIAVLEWTGTWGGVNEGNCNIYRWNDKELYLELSEQPEDKLSFSSCQYLPDHFGYGSDQNSYLLTGSHTAIIRLWSIAADKMVANKCQCLLKVKIHPNVISALEVGLEHAISRDLAGNVYVWDLEAMFDLVNRRNTEESVEGEGLMDKLVSAMTFVKTFDPNSALIIGRRYFGISHRGGCTDFYDVWTQEDGRVKENNGESAQK